MNKIKTYNVYSSQINTLYTLSPPSELYLSGRVDRVFNGFIGLFNRTLIIVEYVS